MTQISYDLHHLASVPWAADVIRPIAESTPNTEDASARAQAPCGALQPADHYQIVTSAPRPRTCVSA